MSPLSKIRRALRRTAVEKNEMMRATASQPQIVVQTTRVIASGSGFKVQLLYVPLRALCDIDRISPADIICLNIHEGGAAVTIREIRRFHELCVDHENKVAPCIIVLGDISSLDREELWLISREMELAGGIFQAWADDCRSFMEAFEALARDLANTYGSIDELLSFAENSSAAHERNLVKV